MPTVWPRQVLKFACSILLVCSWKLFNRDYIIIIIIMTDDSCYDHIWLLLWYFFSFLVYSEFCFFVLNLTICWNFLLDKGVSHYSVLSGEKACLLIVKHMMNWCFLTIHVCIRHFICKSIVRLKCKWTIKRWYTSVIVYSLAPSLDGLIV